jgi:predicted PurR-regulated permease PerM
VSLEKFNSLENLSFVVMLLLATVFMLWIVQGLLLAVFWAALLASIFHSWQLRCVALLKGRESLAALLVMLLIVSIVLVPLALVALAVTRESAILYERVTSGQIDVQAPLEWARRQLPVVSDLLARFDLDASRLREWLSSAAVTVSRFLANKAVTLGQNALVFNVQLFVMLYLLFFFIRDGAALVERIVHAMPLGDRRERLLLAKFAEVSRATLKGTLVIGLIQGIIGGITFALLGIEAAVFWGVVMTVLSVLPAVGAALVWVPAAVWLFASGALVEGVILVAVGSLIIGLIDNFLRPILVGRDTKLPDYLILLSTLGGLATLGISGFVLGPIIAALCLVGWQMFAEEFAEQPDPGRDPDDASADRTASS